MTIVVVVSALYRMHLYEEAYGFTRLRLLVSVFEGWLGVLVLLVIVAGVVGARRWLVPVAIRAGGGRAARAGPGQPLTCTSRSTTSPAPTPRSASTGSTWASCRQTPTLALVRLPDEQFECATRHSAELGDDDWLAWNLSRERARDLMADRPPLARRTQ